MSTAPSEGVGQKAIVQLLCTFVRLEERSTFKKDGAKPIKYEVRKCPHGVLCKNKDALISFQHKTGFCNPIKHLRTCIGKGGMQPVIELYNYEMEQKRK